MVLLMVSPRIQFIMYSLVQPNLSLYKKINESIHIT